ncbi:hypothetical protein VYU27_009171 [Nannochloropsis oceanica]
MGIGAFSSSPGKYGKAHLKQVLLNQPAADLNENITISLREVISFDEEKKESEEVEGEEVEGEEVDDEDVEGKGG